jgi:hypothetical protein
METAGMIIRRPAKFSLAIGFQMKRVIKKRPAIWLGAFVFLAILAIVYRLNQTPTAVVLPDRQVASFDAAIRGRIDSATAENGTLTISGWAIDLGPMRPVSNIEVYVNGESVGHWARANAAL